VTSDQQATATATQKPNAAELHAFSQLALQRQRGREALRYKSKSELQIPRRFFARRAKKSAPRNDS
jgi:hypothetical protein